MTDLGQVRRLRVAVLGIKTLPAFAGADRVVEQLLDHLSDRHEYTVYLVRDGSRPVLSCDGNRRYVYVPALRGKHLRAPSFFLMSCAHYLLEGRYDVAHVHNSDFGLFCPLLRLKRGVRVVGTFHGDPYKRKKWGRFARVFLRLSERAFERSCDVLTSVAPRDGAAILHIPNGVDPAPVDEGPLPAGVAAVPEGHVLFACGRLDATKGLHHLLDAYRRLPEAPPLLAIGDFSHDRAYSAQIERDGEADPRVRLHDGLLDRASLFRTLRRCAVFVFPSEVEAMSMMLLEAISSGAPVVCSDIPENMAIVGVDYPLSFESGNADSLARVLATALVTDTTGVAADLRRRVEAEFRWDAIAARYERLYDGF